MTFVFGAVIIGLLYPYMLVITRHHDLNPTASG